MFAVTMAVGGLIFLAVGTTWTGRSALALLGLRQFRSATPENYSLAAFVGTVLWAMLVGWCSYLGFTAKVGAAAMLATTALLALMCRLTGRRPAAFRPTPALAAGVLVCAVGCAVALLPTLRYGNFVFYGDRLIYCTTSEWLQLEPFHATIVFDRHQLAEEYYHWQYSGARMGSNFLLAACQACSVIGRAWDLFPAVNAFGVLLNLMGVFLVARWALRLSRFYGLVGAFLAGVLTNPLMYSALQTGFMNQLFGTALLCCGLAVLARGAARVSQNWRMAALLGLIHAGLFIYYTELMPVLLAADLGFAATVLLAARRHGRAVAALGYGALIALFGLALANYDLMRAIRTASMWAVAVVGWPVHFDAFRYWAFGLGGAEYHQMAKVPGAPPLGQRFVAVVAVLACLFFLGLGAAVRRKVPASLVAAVVAFGGLFLYFALFVTDPRLQVVGHRWNLFKLCMYAYPLVLAVQLLGLRVVFRDRIWGRATVLIAVALLGYNRVQVHRSLTKYQVSQFQLISMSDDPIGDMRRLRESVEQHSPDFVVIATTSPTVTTLATHAIYPTPVANTLPENRQYINRPSRIVQLPKGVGLIVAPRDDGATTTPFRAVTFDRSEPAVLMITPLGNVKGWGKDESVWINGQPAEIDVYSPTRCRAVLSFLTTPGPCRPETNIRTVRLTDHAGRTRDHRIEARVGARVGFSVELPAGVSRLRLQCLDAPTAAGPSNDPRTLLLLLSQATLRAESPDPDERREASNSGN